MTTVMMLLTMIFMELPTDFPSLTIVKARNTVPVTDGTHLTTADFHIYSHWPTRATDGRRPNWVVVFLLNCMTVCPVWVVCPSACLAVWLPVVQKQWQIIVFQKKKKIYFLNFISTVAAKNYINIKLQLKNMDLYFIVVVIVVVVVGGGGGSSILLSTDFFVARLLVPVMVWWWRWCDLVEMNLLKYKIFFFECYSILSFFFRLPFFFGFGFIEE